MAHKAMQTICWTCRRAVGQHQCVWALWGKPVKGWEAIPTKIKRNADHSSSYCVCKCPQYIPDRGVYVHDQA